MKRQSEEFEVVILGSGLGGLIAGTWLSNANRHVLILKEEGYHPSYLKEGYQFVPFSNFSEKRIKLSLLEKISQALDFSFLTDGQEGIGEIGLKLKRLRQKVAFQVILPKARVDLFSQRPMLQAEWKREFCEEVAQINNFYEEMDRLQALFKKLETEKDPNFLFPIRSHSLIKRWVSFDSLPKGRIDERISSFSKAFKEFIQLQLISLGDFYSEQYPISVVHYLLFNNEKEEWVTNIDLEELKKSIVEKFLQSGGRIEEVKEVGKVEMEWRKGFTLSLKGDQKILQSKYLIFNSPLHRLSNLLSKRKKVILKWGERMKPRYVLIPTFLGIPEKVVPVGMRDLLVSILDLGKPYEGGNVLFLALSPKGDESQAPEGRRALTVQSLMSPDKWNQDAFFEHQKEVMKHLNHLFPFLEKYLDFTDWSWVNHQFLCWSYPHFQYETNSDFQWREGIVPPRLLKDLYFIGKENFPYLGLEGEVLSGLMVGKEISKKYD